jgi:predicted PurR-regulated permease PerM
MLTQASLLTTKKAVFWLFFAFLLFQFFSTFQSVLTPFIIGAVIAYFFDPLVVALERRGIGRLFSTTLILVLFVIVFILLIFTVVPPLAQELFKLIADAPNHIDQAQKLAIDNLGPALKKFGLNIDLNSIKASTDSLAGKGASWLLELLQSAWTGGQAVIGIVSLIVISPIVAFYLLVDWDRLLATLGSWVPPAHRAQTILVFRDIDRALGGFVRGQALVCAIMAAWYGATLSLIGLNSGLILGLITGILTIVPYIGSLTGLMIALAIAVVQFWPNVTPILLLIGAFAAGQFLENYVLAPKLVGEAVGLHPVWLMFALVAFGSLFGFTGVLVAVPLAAVVAVLIRFILSLYLQSEIYKSG